MKILVLFLVLVIAPSFVLAEEVERRTLSVNGEAEVKVVPDEVVINMNVQTKAETLMGAKSKNDKIIKNFISYAKGINISEKDIKTDYVNVRPQYQSCSYNQSLKHCNSSKVLHYTVSNGMQIKLKDLNQYDKLISKAMELGVKYINDVQFVTSELRKHRDKARELASKAAIEKAKDIAKVFGVKLKKPVTIIVNVPYFYYHNSRRNNSMSQNVMQNAGGDSGSPSTLSLGQISIKAKVNVIFEVE